MTKDDKYTEPIAVGQETEDTLKSGNGDVTLVGEVSTAEVAERMIQFATTGLSNSTDVAGEVLSDAEYEAQLAEAVTPAATHFNEDDYRLPQTKVANTTEKILGAKFKQWRQHRSGGILGLFDKKAHRDTTKIKVKKALKQSVNAEREKLYSQFVNRLILLLINGIAVGGLMLAALDYLLTAQIPERSPIVIGLFLGITVYCAGYWGITYKNGKGIEGVRGLASFALIICLVGSVVGGFDVYKNTVNLNTYFMGETIVIKDKKNTANILAGYIDTWRHTPNYSLVHISDTAYYVTVYNSKGESITQLVEDGDNSNNTVDQTTGKSSETLQNLAVCLKDSTAVIVGKDTIERRRDVDNLRYIDLALQWASEGKADIERISMGSAAVPKDVVPNDALPGTEYAVVLSGVDKIKEFYSTVLGEKAASEMLKSLTVGSNTVTLSFHISIATASIGVAAVINVNSEDNLLWYIDNYTEVYDWELGKEDWYKYDYKDADKNEKMIQEAVYNATTMLTKFGADTGLAYNTSSTEKELVTGDINSTDGVSK